MVNESAVVVSDDERVVANAGLMLPALPEDVSAVSQCPGDARRADPRVPPLEPFRILGVR
jgi:hypothetical protein